MDRRAAKSAYLIRLAGREVEYRFVRRRRRTLGLTVDADGLKISAPMRAPWRDIEGFVREKERWILAKLDEWSVAPRPVRLRAESGERLPLFGETVELHRRPGPVRLEGADIGGLQDRPQSPLGRDRMLANELPMTRGHAAKVLRPWPVDRAVGNYVPDLQGAELLRVGRKCKVGVNLPLRK